MAMCTMGLLLAPAQCRQGGRHSTHCTSASSKPMTCTCWNCTPWCITSNLGPSMLLWGADGVVPWMVTFHAPTPKAVLLPTKGSSSRGEQMAARGFDKECLPTNIHPVTTNCTSLPTAFHGGQAWAFQSDWHGMATQIKGIRGIGMIESRHKQAST